MMFYYDKIEWSEITVDDLFSRINSDQPPILLDIRTLQEYQEGHIPNARSIRVTDIKSKIKELEHFKEEEIITMCPGGGLSLVAVDILVDAGFQNVKSLRDGMWEWEKKGYPITTEDEFYYTSEKDRSKTVIEEGSLEEKYSGKIHNTVDARGLICPQPIIRSIKALRILEIGQVLEIRTTDPGSKTDIPAWARSSGHLLLDFDEYGPKDFRFLVKRMK
jgi:TusA-related sulfurtransferase/rhodanese-related sulfurtransferase